MRGPTQEYDQINAPLTPQQQIAAQVARLISQQQAPIRQAQTTYDTQSGQQQAHITALTQALANILGGIAPGVQQTYSNAADRAAAFGKGFSDQIQAAQQARANNTSSFLQNVVGAPDSQVAQVNGQVNPAGAGDALYAIRGFVPASNLNEEGAAYTANAQQLPAVATAQGLREMAAVQAAQQKQDATFAQQLGQIGANAPTLTRQLTNDAFDHNFKVGQANERIDEFNANQAFKLTQAQATAAWRQANLDFKQAGLRLQERKMNSALQRQVAAGAKPDAGLSRIYGHVVDSYGNAILGPNGQQITVKKTSSSSAGLPPWATSGKGEAAAGNAPKVYGPTAAGGFLPAGSVLKIGRVDQGRDLQTTPGTPIVAPGAGVVVRVLSDPGGGGAHFGPSYPVVHFTSGPYAGKTIYIGHTVSALKPGQSFTAGTVLSHTQPSGPSNGGAPDGWAEIGYAPGGTPGAFGQEPPF